MSRVYDLPVDRETQHSFLFKHGTSDAEMQRMVWSSFRSGNCKALEYIFEKHIRLLYAYGSRITKDQALVEDCVQDVFVELWNKRTVISDTDNIKLYLLKSLRRKIIRTLSVKNRLHIGELDENTYENMLEFSVESHLIEEQSSLVKRQRLEEAMKKLSKRQREAVYLKFYEHFSYAEIAEMMDLTVKSTYKLISKAIDSMRKHIRISEFI